jgi:hypothetical protein
MKPILIIFFSVMLLLGQVTAAMSLSTVPLASKNGKCTTEGATTKISGKKYTCTFVNANRGLRWKANNQKKNPAGFSKYNNNISYKWLKFGEYPCSAAFNCIGLAVAAKNSTLCFATLSLLDGAGFLVRSAYAAGNPSADLPATMVFNVWESNVMSFRLNDINCV